MRIPPLTDEVLNKKVERLTASEQVRLAKIMYVTAKLIGAMIETQGPDDARIALCTAYASVFGLDAMCQLKPTQLSQGRFAEALLDFQIEALIERRKL